MHPATKAHICGMLETVRHALKSIETAIAVDSNEGEISQHLAGATAKAKAPYKPMQDDDSPFTTDEEDNEIGRRFSLIGVDQADSGGEI